VGVVTVVGTVRSKLETMVCIHFTGLKPWAEAETQEQDQGRGYETWDWRVPEGSRSVEEAVEADAQPEIPGPKVEEAKQDAGQSGWDDHAYRQTSNPEVGDVHQTEERCGQEHRRPVSPSHFRGQGRNQIPSIKGLLVEGVASELPEEEWQRS
jgi:hypothetical protein